VHLIALCGKRALNGKSHFGRLIDQKHTYWTIGKGE
jgi:hypothetical protein